MMNKTGVTKAQNLNEVQGLRTRQDITQAEQQAQMQAISEFERATASLQTMGTDDTYVAIADRSHDIAYTAANLARDTEERAMEIVNEDLGKARIADDQASKAAANARVMSNVPDALEDIRSGRQAREIQVSIEHERTHLDHVRNTTTSNAQELQQHTNAAVQHTQSKVSQIVNALPR